MRIRPLILFIALSLLTAVVYAPGLDGGFVFDDFPNIVQNAGVQPAHGNIASLVKAALSSPSSEFKRPLASLSFAANYLLTGLNPYWMKVSNVFIHLLNGLLVFLLAYKLLNLVYLRSIAANEAQLHYWSGIVAAWIAGAWMLLPINLTAVLYVVQRMESLANIFVLAGLLSYVTTRNRMLQSETSSEYWRSFAMCSLGVILWTALGLLVKETAAMLPMYALLIEWALFGFESTRRTQGIQQSRLAKPILLLFTLTLFLPLIAGMYILVPVLLRPETWAIRDFTLETRLLSEARIIIDYAVWTWIPLPSGLSFYHDDFVASSTLFEPWTTAACIAVIAVAISLLPKLRRVSPLAALGLALFFACHLLTGTILPLELVYEHRNYFASFGLLLAVIPLLLPFDKGEGASIPVWARRSRYAVLGTLLCVWTAATATTAYAWGDSLLLAQELAQRAPSSPRAQYELGRTYIIESHYDALSPFTPRVYPPLEAAAALPKSSILPEQALIFFNARLNRPLKNEWWQSMFDKLGRQKPGIQDESSLIALVQCAHQGNCELPHNDMRKAFELALSHSPPSARLQAAYGEYSWNVLGEQRHALRLAEAAANAAPGEAAYWLTLARMQVALGERMQALASLKQLQRLNIGGSLNIEVSELKATIAKSSSLPSPNS